MKVSLSWLKEYISVDFSPDELAERLTMAGLEVEGIESRFDYLEDIIVSRVEKTEKHPNADNLTCCTVDVGDNNIVQIVCGAPNVREGLLVPCALPGTVLPGDFTIKKSKIRGEKSAGMLCSGKELKIDSDASGIMELDKDLMPGTSLAQALNLSDYVFEVDLTPNRPDCLSLIGVAREIGAFCEPKAKVSYPDFEQSNKNQGLFSINEYAKVEIIDPDLCPRYAGGFLLDVKVGPSPFWLQQKLESVGLTPINNIVDVTNFVLMETGQPLHAFDYDFLAKGKIVVKRAGETIDFTTLDGKEHKLEPDTLMICDGEKSVAIAGVMGGENSEISESTTKVLVESAYFNPISIRKTAKKTGINTDASHRFERGIDPEGCINALNRAVELMAEISGGTKAKDIIDNYPLKQKPVKIDVNTDVLNTRLGTNLSIDSIKELIESVEFKAEKIKDNLLRVDVPSFRVDVTRPEDLSEEVARLWGYNNIEVSFPSISAQGELLNPIISLRSKARDIMNGFGFSEAINYDFTSPKSVDNLLLEQDDERTRVETILNPISEEMGVLRTSLVPGLLQSMKTNISQQVDTIKLFETGNIFLATRKDSLPEEIEMIAGLWTGSRDTDSIHNKKANCNFFDLKGVVQGFLEGLNIKDCVYERALEKEFPYYSKGYAAIVKKGEPVLGVLGQIKPEVIKNHNLKQTAFIFEIDIKVLLSLMPEKITAEILPKYPAISQDITIIIDSNIAAGSVSKELDLLVQKESLAEETYLFDFFEGKPLAKDKKSLSFRIVYRSPSKTLKEKKVKALHSKICESLISKFNADLPV
ncbi:MAG: phenylalanine--tRNA ligase subunit beta [Desulfobacterales bacterium]|nr:phenylalanine--tRNA ligase subunit beta [Desulfobacterales bacterium]